MEQYTIKILTAGPIRCMGMIHGPIITPYTVNREKLIALLNEGLNIVRVNPNGEDTPLTLNDLADNFSKKQRPSKKEEAPKAEPATETVEKTPVEETEEADPTPVVEPVVADTRKNDRHNNYKNNRK